MYTLIYYDKFFLHSAPLHESIRATYPMIGLAKILIMSTLDPGQIAAVAYPSGTLASSDSCNFDLVYRFYYSYDAVLCVGNMLPHPRRQKETLVL